MKSAQLRMVALFLVIGGLSVIAGIYGWQVASLPSDVWSNEPHSILANLILLTLAQVALAVGFGLLLWTLAQRDPADELTRLGIALLGLGQLSTFASYLKLVLNTHRSPGGWPSGLLTMLIAAELVVAIGLLCFAIATGANATSSMHASPTPHVPSGLNLARWILAAGFAVAAIDAMHTQHTFHQDLFAGGLVIAMPIIAAGAWWLFSTGARNEPPVATFRPLGALVIGVSWWCVVAATIAEQIARHQINPDDNWASTWYLINLAAPVVIAIGFFVLAHELSSDARGVARAGESTCFRTDEIPAFVSASSEQQLET